MFEFEFKGLEMNKPGKLREAKRFEFEFCLTLSCVSSAQRSGPALLVINNIRC